ncbi:hypothetical protein KZZ08_16685 [Roseovarius mucosus]|uniref:hypothetical protein n=1 Tax=Roseovarius TaxID=74030 RepID=UPI001C5E60B7|nr:hypothetical protein [Roseovarius mucosus]MBW4975270.1 hypothetical protein [Roseovarius mucosus]
MEDKNFKFQSVKFDAENSTWRGRIEFDRVYENGNVQRTVLDISGVSAPEGASETNVRAMLKQKAQMEAGRI